MTPRALLSPALRSAIAIVLFAAVFFAPELFGGRVAMTTNMQRWLPWSRYANSEQIAAPSHNPDCATSYYPRRAAMKAAVEDGEIPLWNPYTFCGMPFLADPQTGVLYPPNWFLLPFDPRTQLGLFLFLHVAWGGMGVSALLRRRDVPEIWAGLLGVAFVLNGYFVKHFGQPPFLATAAWVPWVIALALDLRARPDRVRVVRLALAGALLFLAGQPQTAIHAVYAVAIVLLGETIVARGSRAGSGPPAAAAPARLAGGLLAAGGLAALVVAAQLLPTLELASGSARAALPYSTVISGAFHPVDAIRFVVPEFFGTPLTGDEWSGSFPRGDGFYLRNQLNSIFAGTPLFLLALAGMTGRRTWRRAFPFTLLFAVSALVAFGSPLARAAYELLPGFRFSRIDRAGAFVVLAQVVPAGLAVADLAARHAGKHGGRRILGVLTLALALAGLWLAPRLVEAAGVSLDPGPLANAVTRTRVAALFAGGTAVAFLLPASRVAAALPLLLAAVQLFAFAAPYRGDRPRAEVFADAPGLDRLAQVLSADAEHGGGRFLRFGRDLPVHPYPLCSVLPPSTNVPWRLRDTQGYNALADRRLGETLEAALGEGLFSHGIWAGRRIVAPERSSSMEHPLLDALAVRAAVGAVPLSAAGWVAEPGHEFSLWLTEEAAPRVRLAESGRGVTAAEMSRILASRAFDPSREAIWVGEGDPVGDSDPENGRAAAAAGTVELLSDRWNSLEVRTNAPAARVLVVADAWSPGWVATVDGRPAEILTVWGVVRGVRLAEGAHRVKMVYRPASFRRGALLSLLGIVVAGLGLSWPTRPRRPTPGADSLSAGERSRRI